MAKHTLDYTVSALVVLLNQHLWCHISSCSSNLEQQWIRHFVDTCFRCYWVAKAQLNEYITGVNMLQKSNTSRLKCCTYACSIKAASRKRKARRRSFIERSICDENRQEIAGPLAAFICKGCRLLFQLKCVPSTLGDVVRQLCKSSEYSCYLVGGNEEVRKSKFHVVSFLDDYVNRPKLLSNVNLYGFMMRCFRKEKDQVAPSEMSFFTWPINFREVTPWGSVISRLSDKPTWQAFRSTRKIMGKCVMEIKRRFIREIDLFEGDCEFEIEKTDDLINIWDLTDTVDIAPESNLISL
ncbi:hypothetical protein GQ600_5018 [Phytophthora cactorum]|nr:hypothetical protein GQ600_5018 [Phytophthora cactorum]